MSTDGLRALEALRTRRVQDEDAAAEALAAALSEHRRAVGAAEAAAAKTRRAADAVADARRFAADAVRVGTTALAANEAARFSAACRDRLATCRDAQAQADAVVTTRTQLVARARDALAEAKGQREAVEKRIEAVQAELRRAAEARVEDEVADRVAFRRPVR